MRSLTSRSQVPPSSTAHFKLTQYPPALLDPLAEGWAWTSMSLAMLTRVRLNHRSVHTVRSRVADYGVERDETVAAAITT